MCSSKDKSGLVALCSRDVDRAWPDAATGAISLPAARSALVIGFCQVRSGVLSVTDFRSQAEQIWNLRVGRKFCIMLQSGLGVCCADIG